MRYFSKTREILLIELVLVLNSATASSLRAFKKIEYISRRRSETHVTRPPRTSISSLTHSLSRQYVEYFAVRVCQHRILSVKLLMQHEHPRLSWILHSRGTQT